MHVERAGADVSRPSDSLQATFQPTKALVVNLEAPDAASSVNIIDALSEVVGLRQVFMVQHLQGSRFQVTLYTATAVEKLFAHGELSICGQKVAIETLTPRVTRVACLQLPSYVPDEYLVRALAPYGKVVKLERPTTTDRPTVCNGIRVAWVEMKPEKPVPNFLRVLEHRITCDYPGMTRVCSRCKQPGHFRTACDVPFCRRCSTYGHDVEECTARCRRCAGDHATNDCHKRRSFAEALTNATRRPLQRSTQPNTRGDSPPADEIALAPLPEMATQEAVLQGVEAGAPTASVSPEDTPLPSDELVAASPPSQVSSEGELVMDGPSPISIDRDIPDVSNDTTPKTRDTVPRVRSRDSSPSGSDTEKSAAKYQRLRSSPQRNPATHTAPTAKLDEPGSMSSEGELVMDVPSPSSTDRDIPIVSRDTTPKARDTVPRVHSRDSSPSGSDTGKSAAKPQRLKKRPQRNRTNRTAKLDGPSNLVMVLEEELAALGETPFEVTWCLADVARIRLGRLEMVGARHVDFS
ncbi:hypothetical protein HPB47_015857 [Ixodes persulcatus]|uniref:Uncharacterized protein n=1 Tax=Ixodes persulcatus TaxID=34615 RepID=A0AC60QSA6_IXOPE|nr:hypothetical protein HPB47_015857 [Ixodes persulcatus]